MLRNTTDRPSNIRGVRGVRTFRGDRSMTALATIGRALSHEFRCRLLFRIARQAIDVSTIGGLFNEQLSLVSHHLSLLREADLVRVQAEANRRIYHLSPIATASFRGKQTIIRVRIPGRTPLRVEIESGPEPKAHKTRRKR